jgi:hypothetical protein
MIFKDKQRHIKRKEIYNLLEYDKRDGERNVCRPM